MTPPALESVSVAGMPALRIRAPGGPALLLLQGAQLWHCQLSGRELLYQSQATTWQLGAAPRGGIPLCWPWLGNHPDYLHAGMHGHVRTTMFRLLAWRWQGPAIKVILESALPANLPGMHSRCLLRVAFAWRRASCTIQLRIHNQGDHPQPSAGAMHSYLRCSAAHSRVKGVVGCPWHGPDDSDQSGILGQPYNQVLGRCTTVHDSGPQPRPLWLYDQQRPDQAVRIQRLGSRSCVLWNPGTAHALPDLGPHEAEQFLCVETANCDHDRRVIAPGGTHTMVTRYGLVASDSAASGV